MGDVVQDAVASQTHCGMAFIGLDVDVRSPFPNRLGQQGIDHADDWCVILCFEQVGDGRQLGHQLLDVDVLADVGQDLGSGAVAVAEVIGESTVESLCRDTVE